MNKTAVITRDDALKLLHRFLLSAFDNEELETLLSSEFGESFVKVLPPTKYTEQEKYVAAVIRALERHGNTIRLLPALSAKRPNRQEEITRFSSVLFSGVRAPARFRKLPLERFQSASLPFVPRFLPVDPHDPKTSYRDAMELIDQRLWMDVKPGDLQRSSRRVVPLLGDVFGVGCSRLACAYADARRDRYVWYVWIDVGVTAQRNPMETSARVRAALAARALDLGWPEDPGTTLYSAGTDQWGKLAESALDHLCALGKGLIILDDLGDPEVVDAVLPQEGDFHVIVTSNAVEPWPDAIHVPDMRHEQRQAIQMVLGLHAHSVEIFNQQWTFAKELVDMVGALPLGLSLIAQLRLVTGWTPKELWEKMNRTQEARGDGGRRILRGPWALASQEEPLRIVAVLRAAIESLGTDFREGLASRRLLRAACRVRAGAGLARELLFEIALSLPGTPQPSKDDLSRGLNALWRRGLLSVESLETIRVHPFIAEVARRWAEAEGVDDVTAIVESLIANIQNRVRRPGWSTQDRTLGDHLEELFDQCRSESDLSRVGEALDLYVVDVESTGDMRYALQLVERYLTLSERHPALLLWSVRLHCKRGHLQHRILKRTLAQESYAPMESFHAARERLKRLRDTGGPLPPERRARLDELESDILHGEGKELLRQGEVKHAEEALLTAVSLLEPHAERFSRELAWVSATLAQALKDRAGDRDEPQHESLLERALEAERRAITLLGDRHEDAMDSVGILQDMAKILLDLADLVPARRAEHLESADLRSMEALELAERTLGSCAHPVHAYAHTTRARVLRERGALDEALKHAQAGAEQLERLESVRSVNYAFSLQTIGTLLLDRRAHGDLSRSRQELARAVRILHDAGNPHEPLARFDLAVSKTSGKVTSKRESQIAQLSTLWRGLEESYGPDHPLLLERRRRFDILKSEVEPLLSS